MIKVENLHKKFNQLEVLKGIDVNVEKGEIIAIIGPSGSGKSTFLRCINRLEEPTDGKIFIDGENILDKKTDINKIREKVGMVFQHFNLFPHKTVMENIILAPMKLKGCTKEQAETKALELLQKVGLVEKKDTYPNKLSGGQKQRIAIARALAMEPEVIMIDLAKDGMTMLIVTHEMGFAKNVASRILFMNDGIILEDETPEEFFNNPKHSRTKEFLYKVLNK